MIHLNRLLKKYGWALWIRLAFYPVITLITTPIRLIQTLWSSRVLLDGRWGRYPHFLPLTAINTLFYWTRALGLYRFGRAGRIPYLGTGNSSLSGFFFYSLPSFYMFWIASAPTILIGMFGWWLSHFIWLKDAPSLEVGVVMGMALISTTFYLNLSRQNYNVLGWMFFPLGIYGLTTGNWLLAGLVWVLVQWSGITVLFLGGILSFVAAYINWSIIPVLTLVPAGLLVATRFWPSFIHGDFGKILSEISKAIGLTERKAKYQRTSSKSFDLRVAYHLFLYVQFLAAVYLITGNIPLFYLSGVLVYLVNSVLFRFADPQSMYMFMLSLGTYTAVLYFHPILLPFYWLLISPLPGIMNFPTKEPIVDTVPLLSPFDVQPLLEGMQNFLAPAQKGQRVLMAFQDPAGVYENIFDGQRVLVELPSYVATVNEVHFMPEWSTVFELNYEGAPELWGRDIQSVLKNAKYWQADFAVIYQDAGEELDPKWKELGFTPLERFAWSKYTENLGRNFLNIPLPDWWLLKTPN